MQDRRNQRRLCSNKNKNKKLVNERHLPAIRASPASNSCQQPLFKQSKNKKLVNERHLPAIRATRSATAEKGFEQTQSFVLGAPWGNICNYRNPNGRALSLPKTTFVALLVQTLV